MGTTIREAGPGDEGEIVAMYPWLFAPPGTKPGSWDPKRAVVALTDAIASDDSVVLVAEYGGELVGFLTAYMDIHSVRFGYRVWVEDFAVHPDHRSRGIGKSLLDAAKAWAAERGATHLELDSAEERKDAHRFYEREGAEYRSYSFGWTL